MLEGKHDAMVARRVDDIFEDMSESLDRQTGNERLKDSALFNRIDEVIRDKKFLVEVADACDRAYREEARKHSEARGEVAADWMTQELFSAQEREVLLHGRPENSPEVAAVYDKAQKKLATNTAGFYAIQDALGLLHSLHQEDPFIADETLTAVDGDKASPQLMDIFARFAHATWAAGQPFKDRETRPVMQPFDLLSEDEKAKDFVQIHTAAHVLRSRIHG
jgi:hypothetical protein